MPKISGQESVEAVKNCFRNEFLKGCGNRLGLLKCPRSLARTVVEALEIVLQERISERMCEHIGVVEMPKISCQECVEAVIKTEKLY